jgi:chemotaxis regulatin CheY-phosphate phosphatase CheZ
MTPKQPSELLYDSEATLRQVDSAILDMGELGEAPEAPLEERMRDALSKAPGANIGLVGLSDLLARGYNEILGVLDSLRQGRHLLERAAVEKIQHTHDKLQEVSATTEVAATDILNGLDRATSMVDELDTLAEGDGNEKSSALRAALRDELFALMGHMQFQDITSQQLNYASSVLNDMEARLAQVARAFDPAAYGVAAAERPEATAALLTYDPDASTANREERQAVANEIVATTLGNS